MSVSINPFEMAQSQFDKVADQLKLDPSCQGLSALADA